MYKLNPNNNVLEPIQETSFYENDLKEREHIEEWIRKSPEMLGEELLIIGHEYDKFEVNERLDLLAVDKEGSLVIIEVKRDTTGGHVDLQALKYASYCSRLSPSDVVELYSDYIAKFGLGVDPVEELTSFLNVESEEDLNTVINHSQRIIIAAKEIDKRILSVCTWLYENNIDIKCVTIKPYQLNDEIIIDTNQILPPYKLEDFYINKKSPADDKKIHISKDVSGFLQEVTSYINSHTNYKLSYAGKRDYITGPKFLNLPWRFIFVYKKKKNFASIFIESNQPQGQELIQELYSDYYEYLKKELDCEMELVTGSKDTELYKLVARMELDEHFDADFVFERYVRTFEKFKMIIEDFVKRKV